MGVPIFSTLHNGFPADAIYILELSSYQLELCDYLTLDVAIILNLFPHHLERHGTMDRYRAIKETILQGARIGWVPKDWPTNGNTHWDDCTQPLISGQQVFQGSVQRWSSDCVQDYDLPKCLSGTHNRENVAATVAVLRALQCTKTDIFQDFTGLEHRQEWVAHANGIGYCNDSKATNPHAVVKAIQAYSSHPIFWIAGGVLQNDDLDVLDSCVQSVAHGFMIGQAGPRYAQWLQDRGKSATLCSSLQDAVHRAHALAVSAVYDGCVGITILLSPGCASFDEFRDFEHRGHVFKQCVWECLGQSDLSEPSHILSGSIS